MLYFDYRHYKQALYPGLLEKINIIQGRPPTHDLSFSLNNINVGNPFLSLIFNCIEKGLFKDPNAVNFCVETGTFLAETTMHCASLFAETHTIEKYPPHRPGINLYNNAPSNHYSNVKQAFPNITFWDGDVTNVLQVILSTNPTKRGLFILDAHNGNAEVPLLKELEIISKYSYVKDHWIIIDDGCECGKGNFPAFEDILIMLKKINKNYNLINTFYRSYVLVGYVGN